MQKNHKQTMTRSAMRGLIVEELYRMDIHGDYSYEAYSEPFINKTLDGVIANMDALDSLITENLKGWSLRRLSFVDRAILRLAVYEMRFTDTGKEIAIDEALELTKRYSDEGDRKHVSFNNRVLDTVKKALERA
ncbi:MAG: transcription antitermination factor NusB [Bacillota bacterium]